MRQRHHTPLLDRTATAVVVWLVAWVRPRWAVRRQEAEGLGIGWAWLVTLLSVAAAVIGLPALTQWAEGVAFDGPSSPLPLIISTASLIWRTLTDTFNTPLELARLAALIILCHGLWVVAAWVHLAWSTRPGRPIDLLRQALRSVSWTTPAAVTLLLGITTTLVFWEAATEAWIQAMADELRALYLASGTGSPLSIAPWWVVFVNEGQILFTLVTSLAGYAWLTAAIRATPWPARCVWPPRCTACGYALVGVDPQGTCPECGQPVPQSLHPVFDFLSPDQKETDAGKRRRFPAFTAWLRHGRTALFHPKQLGRATPLYSLNPGHAASRFITGLALFLIALLGMGSVHLLHSSFDTGFARDLSTRQGIVYAYAIIPTLVTLTGLGVMQVTATLAATTYTRKDAGATLPAAAALASYNGLYLVLASACLWAFVSLLITFRYVFNPDEFLTDLIAFEYVELSLIAVPIVALLLWAGYHQLLGRSLRAARFNNH